MRKNISIIICCLLSLCNLYEMKEVNVKQPPKDSAQADMMKQLQDDLKDLNVATEINSTKIVTLTDDTIFEELTKNKNSKWLIMFCTPYNPFCDQLKKKWVELVTTLESDNKYNNIYLGEVDCKANKATCKMFKTKRFPDLKCIPDTKGDKVTVYSYSFKNARQLFKTPDAASDMLAFILGSYEKAESIYVDMPPQPTIKEFMMDYLIQADEQFYKLRVDINHIITRRNRTIGLSLFAIGVLIGISITSILVTAKEKTKKE